MTARKPITVNLDQHTIDALEADAAANGRTRAQTARLHIERAVEWVHPAHTWLWCGYAGHFIGAQSCLFHMHTRVGDWRVSTVGDYRPDGPHKPAADIGYDRLYETAVFVVEGEGDHGEGTVTNWSDPGVVRHYREGDDACAGHRAVCDVIGLYGQWPMP